MTQANPTTQQLIRLGQGEGYGGRPYQPGATIWEPLERVRRSAPDVECITVEGQQGRSGRVQTFAAVTILTAEQEYISSDGLSFGVGDDAGYIYRATARPATAEEAAPLLAAFGRAGEIARAEGRLREIVAAIRDQGERPRQAERPTGTTVWERTTVGDTYLPLYGGGQWLIIGDDGGVWLLQGNSADGDDWSASNIPGYLAWRVDATPELTDELRALAATLAG